MVLKVVKAGMQTSAVKTKPSNRNKQHYIGQQGFTLIEILMAIFLVFVVVSIVPLTTGGDARSKLEDTMRKVERAVRFATNESILQNKIVRIKFEFTKDATTYLVEVGQKANLVLPQSKDLQDLSLKEREKELENIKKVDSQFAPVAEFEKDNEPLPDGIEIYAIGTTYYPDLMKEAPFYIYFYPTGEKDSSILFFNTLEELATLTIFPFEDRVKKDFFIFNEIELNDIDATIEKKAKDLFLQWQKD